jgi:organic radical activating enzyme
LFVADPVSIESSTNYQRGWLAGMADGDGCFWTLKHRRGYRRFRLALKDRPLLVRAEHFARECGYELRWGKHRKVGFTGTQTLDCLWLTKDGEVRAFERWLAENLRDTSWCAGYLGGILDAEGSHSAGVIRISQLEGHQRVRTRIAHVLRYLELKFTNESTGFYVHRTNGQAWRALAIAQPAKRRLLTASHGHHPHVTRVISSVESSGSIEEVVQLTTSTGTFVAAGFVVKNCDTKYTWDWQNHDRQLETLELPVTDVAAGIRDRAGRTVQTVVVTGGEPLLQQQDLVELFGELRKYDFRIEIETSGTIEPVEELAKLVAQWNVSPKLSNSGNALPARLRGGPLTWFAGMKTANFKFVITHASDLDEVEQLCSRFGIERHRILLMPEATESHRLVETGRWLADECVKRGFRLTTRLHVSLWDTVRGR